MPAPLSQLRHCLHQIWVALLARRYAPPAVAGGRVRDVRRVERLQQWEDDHLHPHQGAMTIHYFLSMLPILMNLIPLEIPISIGFSSCCPFTFQAHWLDKVVLINLYRVV